MTPTEQERRAARAVQALVGIILAAAGVATIDWRYGLITFGILTLATSGAWRTAK